MSDPDVFDTGIDMEPLKNMIWTWCGLQFAISRCSSPDKLIEDSRRLEFHIVDYVRQACWNVLMTGTEEQRDAMRRTDADVAEADAVRKEKDDAD